IHTAGWLQSLLDGLGVRQWTWPARSPDLNVIENIWGLMKRNLLTRDLHQASSEVLREAVKQKWTNLQSIPSLTSNLYESIPRRLREVISTEG
ncbi:hypothetical protein HPB47_003873, partial [Ixodes persulcatus]